MTPSRGLLLAFAALVCWSISPFFFTNMGKRVGAVATNLLRLSLASILLILLSLMRGPAAADAGALPGPAAWLWLAASGVIGLAIGDAFLYKAFVSLGPERTSQFQTLAPAATAAMAWAFLAEFLSAEQVGGMGLVLAGVYLATWSSARGKAVPAGSSGESRIALLSAEARAEGAAGMEAAERESGKRRGYLGTGVWAAIWSALFQGLGTVLAREAFLTQPTLDPVLATTIRIGAGTLALWAYVRVTGPVRAALGDWTRPQVLRLLACGTLFGPVLGMLAYVSALKAAPAGIVTTVTFMAPLLIIPIGARLYGTRITAATLWGTALSLAGVALLGLG